MRQWIKKLNWAQSFGCVLVIIVVGKLAFGHSSLLPFRWVLGGIFLVFKYYADWPDTAKRLRVARHKSLAHQLIQVMPPIFPALVRMHNATYSNFYKWLKREPIAWPQMEGERFQFYDKSQYGTALIIFFLACAVDIPFSALMIGLLGHDSAQNLRIHLTIFLLTLYAIFFVLGDRWALKGSSHVLGTDVLYLRLGERFSADLPLENILSAQAIDEPIRLWCARKRKSSFETINVSPVDPPNVLLTLKIGPSIEVESFKTNRTMPEYVFLYVDDPRHFLSELASRRDT